MTVESTGSALGRSCNQPLTILEASTSASFLHPTAGFCGLRADISGALEMAVERGPPGPFTHRNIQEFTWRVSIFSQLSTDGRSAFMVSYGAWPMGEKSGPPSPREIQVFSLYESYPGLMFLTFMAYPNLIAITQDSQTRTRPNQLRCTHHCN